MACLYASWIIQHVFLVSVVGWSFVLMLQNIIITEVLPLQLVLTNSGRLGSECQSVCRQCVKFDASMSFTSVWNLHQV